MMPMRASRVEDAQAVAVAPALRLAATVRKVLRGRRLVVLGRGRRRPSAASRSTSRGCEANCGKGVGTNCGKKGVGRR